MVPRHWPSVTTFGLVFFLCAVAAFQCESHAVFARSAVEALAARGLGALLAEGGANAFRQMSNSPFSFGGGCRFFDIFPGCGALFCGCHSAEKMTFIRKKGIGFTTQMLL